MATVRVGVSGWAYAPWRGRFYPAGLPRRLELAYAARRFNALEVNGTFYALQRPEAFASWREQTPEGFELAIKGGRYVTHMRRLKDVRRPLANFFASGLLRLGDRLGPILWQFPARLAFDEARFRAFFERLPRDTAAMARLAREHDAWMRGRAWVEPMAAGPVRHAVEVRHESFMREAFIALLREWNIALVVADTAGKFPLAEDVTADFVYVRLHGSRRLYASGYTPREVEHWARRVERWRDGGEPDEARRVGPAARARRSGRDVYVFFDNTDVKMRAPVDARRLAERLGVAPPGTPAQVVRSLTGRAGRAATARRR